MSERVLPPSAAPRDRLRPWPKEGEIGKEEESLFTKIVIIVLLVLEVYFFVASMYADDEIVPQDFRTMENGWTDNWFIIGTFHPSHGVPTYRETAQVIHANDTWIVRGFAQEIVLYKQRDPAGKILCMIHVRMNKGEEWSLPTEFRVDPENQSIILPEDTREWYKDPIEFVFIENEDGYEIRKTDMGYWECDTLDLSRTYAALPVS